MRCRVEISPVHQGDPPWHLDQYPPGPEFDRRRLLPVPQVEGTEEIPLLRDESCMGITLADRKIEMRGKVEEEIGVPGRKTPVIEAIKGVARHRDAGDRTDGPLGPQVGIRAALDFG